MTRRVPTEVTRNAAAPRGMLPAPAGSRAATSSDDEIDELAGEGEEAVGRATDDPDLVAEGRSDQARSNLERAGEEVEDAFRWRGAGC